jgi:hypothetical protein
MEPMPLLRHTVDGTLTDGIPTTTAVEVTHDRRAVVLRLIDDELFTVALVAPDVAHVITAVRAGEISYVSAEHTRYGHVLLGVRPHGIDPAVGSPKPMLPSALMLYLELPHEQVCEVVLDAAHSAEFVRHLDDGLRLIGPPALSE